MEMDLALSVDPVTYVMSGRLPFRAIYIVAQVFET